MHLDALKYFQYIVEEKSISKAAQKAHISQSALSQMIRKLEEDLNQSLLNRSNKGVTPTAQGEIVLRYATNIINNFDKMISELEQYDSGDRRITISGTPSLAAYSLPGLIYKVKKQFPEVHIDLLGKSVESILEDLQNDMADFGFVDEWQEKDDLIYHKMRRENIVLTARNDYEVADQISLTELFDKEMILCRVNQKIGAMLETELKKVGRTLEDLNVIFHADSVWSVKSSVLNGFGMAFMPYEFIQKEFEEKSVKLIDVADVDLDYDVYMVTRKPKYLSKTANAFLEYMHENGRRSLCSTPQPGAGGKS